MNRRAHLAFALATASLMMPTGEAAAALSCDQMKLSIAITKGALQALSEEYERISTFSRACVLHSKKQDRMSHLECLFKICNYEKEKGECLSLGAMIGDTEYRIGDLQAAWDQQGCKG